MTNDYFLFSLKNRLTIFNYSLFLGIIEFNTIQYIDNWNLLTENFKIPNKINYYYDFIFNILKEQVIELKKIEKKNHSKSVILLNLQKPSQYSNRFENYDKFLKQNIKILKKLHKRVIFTDLDFTETTGTYMGIKCLEENGEEIEFLKQYS
jgi:hypothetical protein